LRRGIGCWVFRSDSKGSGEYRTETPPVPKSPMIESGTQWHLGARYPLTEMSISPLLCVVFLWAGGQESTVDPKLRSVPSCSQVLCQGKRVAHTLGQFEFCVPRGLKFRRVVGFEGDVHDRISLRVSGELSELVMFTANATWGPVKAHPNDWPSAGPTPEDNISVRQWQCSEGGGHDFSFHRDSRYWRMVAFPGGFAEYKNVPPGAAEQLDRVLDSLCCQKVF
jgi:hypothetical protein